LTWTWTGPQRVLATVPLTVSARDEEAEGAPVLSGTMPGAAAAIGAGGAPPRLVR
jgi:hypothetical protein